MERRIRLLIVSYYFPPAAGGGVQRVLKYAKYLPEFGIDVDVLTVDDPQWMDSNGDLAVPSTTTVHRSKYVGPAPRRPTVQLQERHGLSRLWRKVLLQPRRLFVPDLHAPWLLTAKREGKSIVRERNIDVVMSTSPPETDHLIGRALTNRSRALWIADFRDSWLEEPGLRLDKISVRIKNRLNRSIAKRILPRADLITTVSSPITDEMQRHYPTMASSGKIATIMNGVDLDDFEGIEHGAAHETGARPGTLSIVYTGNFFGRRTPRPFLRGVLQAIEDSPEIAADLHVRFVGTLKPEDEAWIGANEKLSPIVTVEPFQPYTETLRIQRSADLLLLVIADTPRTQGEVTGKVFEYVAARRPLLAVIPDTGAAAKLLGQVSGTEVVAPANTDEIAQTLIAAWRTWQEHGTEPLPMDANIEQLISRRCRAANLAAQIRKLFEVE